MYDVNEVPESKDMVMTLLPKGGYRVVIAKVEKKFKDNNIHSGSSYLTIEMHILPYDGVGDYDYAGRRLFTRCTVKNPNPKAVEIGKAQTCDIMFACNVARVNHDTELPGVLGGKEMYVEVDIQPRYDNGKPENVVKGYWTLSGRQRRKNPKPKPLPPTPEDIASAPPLPPRTPTAGANQQGQGYTASSASAGHAFEDVPF